eukprot:TRINITY_DN11678_c0_g1_i1.p3 TRINITY_DN11678_c0_g1~~TRINITY_DN11678_c0_g1_i1.p3  ORF type:complete len:286 (-),score=22.00 TRINITY_DN11678_c0_g1_i1:3741-4598(-)
MPIKKSSDEGRATALISFWGSMNQRARGRGKGSNSNRKNRAPTPVLSVIKSEIEKNTQKRQQKEEKEKEQEIEIAKEQEVMNEFQQDQQQLSNQESGVGNVQQLVQLFESKQDDVGKVKTVHGPRYSRPPSVCSGWSGVGRPHQVLQRRQSSVYEYKDTQTESVSSVGSNSMWSRYERQSQWEYDVQSRLNGRNQACQVMVTRFANGGIEGVVIQNEPSTVSETSSWSSYYNVLGDKSGPLDCETVCQDARIQAAKEKFRREESMNKKYAPISNQQQRMLQLHVS